MTDKETVELISSFYAVYDASFNCKNCIKKMSQVARDELKGCSVISEKPVAKWKDSIVYKTCPVNFYNQRFVSYIDLFRHFDKGLLPFEGGLLEQPNKIMDVFNLIETLKIDDDRDRMEKQQKANKRVQEKWRTK